MQKLTQNQKQITILSPQQIQFIKLLQIPTSELNSRIEEELESNPILEDGRSSETESLNELTNNTRETEYEDKEDYNNKNNEDYDDDYNSNNNNDDYDEDYRNPDEISINQYLPQDDYGSYNYQDNNYREEEKEMPIIMTDSLNDNLIMQVDFLGMSERHRIIALQIIGSMDSDGYLRRRLEAIVNDLIFTQNLETDEEEVELILKRIQSFDPAGIGARSLQECLIIQLERKINENPLAKIAITLLDEYFEEFTKKHYEKISKKLDLTDPQLKEIINLILKLNPKPGETSSNQIKAQYVIPDFILHNNNNGKLHITLNAKNAPELRINNTYADMLDTYSKSDKKDRQIRDTVSFVKQKLDAAKWFIDAIKQRQNTLLKTMNAILTYQYEFFLEGDESKFKPMILKDIADKINMDISTVSRVANSKSIQTDFGVFPLKYFFSEGISTEAGEDVSSREVKHILKEFVDNENKRKPLSDDKLEKMLKNKGYQIARRTVAKYREQLEIPVARLRKKL